MSLIRIENIENTTEELIIAGMISNTAYLSWLFPRYKNRYFKNDQTRMLADIIVEYYEINHKAPESSITELYESMIDHMDEEDVAITRKILGNVERKYNGNVVAFEILSDATDDYFETRSIEILTDTLEGLVQRGRIEEAVETIEKWYKDPKGAHVEAVSPYDISFAPKILETQVPIYRFRSDLDRLFPRQTKNKLYTFLGGTKSGKSQWLGWLATEFLNNGLKVCVWEYELQQVEFLHRALSAITGKGIDGQSPDREIVTTLSVFDCAKNRDDSCENPERPENDYEGDWKEYEEGVWTPCTVCRGTEAFDPVVWKMPFRKKIINRVSALIKEQEKWMRQTKDNLRIFNHDPGTQTVEQIKGELERLKLVEGFIPDVLIIDQADNLVPAKRYNDKRHELSNVWSDLSTLAKHGYLVWTASQTNRTGWNKEWITADMIAEDASKLMIADGTVTINQYRGEGIDEFAWNTQRLRAEFYRGQAMPPFDIKVLHDFSRYIACIDCSILRRN